jgi:hypothetical protein
MYGRPHSISSLEEDRDGSRNVLMFGRPDLETDLTLLQSVVDQILILLLEDHDV